MPIAVSTVVLSVALYVVLFKADDRKARDWAFGAIGLILGYWLK
jgi:hypothetical protein